MENELLQAFRTLLKEELKSINDRLDKIDTRFDNLEDRFDNLENRFDGLEDRFNTLESKMDSNHTEVMRKLSELKNNQEAIRDFILNSDNTFRKADVSFDFSEKIKKSLSEW